MPTSNRTTFLAIDGGGTKTEGVRVTADGRILARARVGATNPNDLGRETACARLAALLDQLSADSRDAALFAGIAGAIGNEDALRAVLAGRAARVGVGSDAVNLLSAMGRRDGACLIAGTGSVCFARRGEEIRRIGGWGYLLDNGGSGYDIGRDGLSAALRAHDGRGEPTMLTERLTEALGEPVHTAIPRIYREGKPFIAALAPIVFAAAEDGDAAAAAILDRNADCLAELLRAAAAWLGADAPMPVQLGGSILTAADAMRDRLADRVSAGITLHRSPAPPVWGAACEAMALAGIEPEAGALERFAEEHWDGTAER